MSDLIFLTPIFHEKIWGGRRLQTSFGYDIPDGPIGECWAISAHPHGDCVVSQGAYAGMHLSELWASHRELFGGMEGDEFPLLIKIIDADGDLSIQVHPDNEYAAANENGSLGKCECWYVLDCDEDATIVVGQNASGPDEFRSLVKEGRWSDLVNELPIQPGDFFQIDPGTIHAIKGGTMVLETQQSCDVTYRVYDYDRVQDDGTKRPLHLEQSIECTDYKAVAPASGKITTPEVDGVCELVSCEYYTVDRVRVDGPRTIEAPETFLNVSVIDGEGTACGVDVKRGSHFVVPAGVTLELDGHMVIVASRP